MEASCYFRFQPQIGSARDVREVPAMQIRLIGEYVRRVYFNVISDARVHVPTSIDVWSNLSRMYCTVIVPEDLRASYMHCRPRLGRVLDMMGVPKFIGTGPNTPLTFRRYLTSIFAWGISSVGSHGSSVSSAPSHELGSSIYQSRPPRAHIEVGSFRITRYPQAYSPSWSTSRHLLLLLLCMYEY